MTHNASIFKELNEFYFSKVTIGNGENLRCTIFDLFGCELMLIKMRNRSFSLQWKKKVILD
ncbi:hypothetical protein CR513_08828, partial [Mucuna pruriens]